MPSPGRGAPQERISFLAKVVPPPPEAARRGRSPVPRSVAELARRLPLERKVAQLFAFGFRGTDLTADIFGRLRRQDLGGIVLAPHNYIDSTQLGGLAAEAHRRRARGTARAAMGAHLQEGAELNTFADLPPSRCRPTWPPRRRPRSEATRRPPPCARSA